MKQNTINYFDSAELYTVNRGRGVRQSMGFKRFDSAAKAIRYSMEELPHALLPGSMLEVNEIRYHHNEIRALYESNLYPLPKKNVDEGNTPNAELPV